jgi:pyridoxal phosphate enzyme (YggS family)
MSIAENLDRLHSQIADTCARAHRSPADVQLMAVSKVHPANVILEAHSAGQRLFGENRVQEFADKFPLVTHLPGAEFHLIGPLQNNKTTPAAQLFHSVDTIDSLKTAQRLDTAAAALGKNLSLLIEVKLSPEDTKHGLPPDDLATLLDDLATLTHVRAVGLMTVPPFTASPEEAETARPYFQHLRRLRDQHQRNHPGLTQLSIGMSNDFPVAIEEGSTTIRVGTALFGKRQFPT